MTGVGLLGPLADIPLDELVALLEECDDLATIEAIIAALEDELVWQPWPHQIPPEGDWTIWLMNGGRGAGKTDGCANWMEEHTKGPPCDPRLPGGHRMSIIGPTLADTVESCVNGPSGLKAHNPDVQLSSPPGGTIVKWPSGAEAKLFGGYTRKDVERFRAGGNRCAAWIEEAAAIPQIDGVLEQIPFGHRLGPHPRVVMSTTPKPRAFLKRLIAFARAWRESGELPRKRWERVVLTRGTTDDNPALDKEVRQGLYDEYGGSRLGRQELAGEMIDDFEGALWSRARIDALRIHDVADMPTLHRRCIGVDPSTWGVDVGGRDPEAGELARGIETGIIVSGIDTKRHLYTLADYSKRCSPAEWGELTIVAYVRHHCAAVVPEVNAGGALVTANIAAAESLYRLKHPDCPPVRIKPVRASDGKRSRAEPVAALGEFPGQESDDESIWDVARGRHHMVGTHALLEDQLCQWDPNEAWSPDRLDAMVWTGHFFEPWKRRKITGATSADTQLPV